MVKFALALTAVLSALSVSDAATKVAVLEFGKGGAVRRTTSTNAATDVQGVASFWNALHRGRKLQQAGMTVVPDLFHKAHVGIVMGLTGIDGGLELNKMPTIASLFTGRDSGSSAVGHMKMEGHHCGQLLGNVDAVESVEDASALRDAIGKHASMDGLSGLEAEVDASNMAQVDGVMGSVMADLQRAAEESGKNIILHLIIEDDEEETVVEPMHRRLEDEQGEGEGEDDNANGNQYNGYYGYGYYNAYGEWVTPYKTMFQIQYFNVVLWTAVGLTFALFYIIYLMMYMPLEPDTLLFGESAKMLGDD